MFALSNTVNDNDVNLYLYPSVGLYIYLLFWIFFFMFNRRHKSLFIYLFTKLMLRSSWFGLSVDKNSKIMDRNGD